MILGETGILILLGLLGVTVLVLLVAVFRLAAARRAGPSVDFEVLRREIDSLKESFSKSQEADNFFKGKLSTQLDELGKISSRLAEETSSMNSTLKGNNRSQGVWGEVVLERVLELSGLRPDVDFKRQPTFTLEDGSRLRPDLLVLLPGQRFVVIDAKVSLTAWARWNSSLGTGQIDNAALKEHVQSIRSQILTLSQRNYPQIHGASSLDSTLMFIPQESALAAAVEADPELLPFAAQLSVIPVTPSTLMLALQLVHQVWERREADSRASKLLALGKKILERSSEAYRHAQAVEDKLQQSLAAVEKLKKNFDSPRDGLLKISDVLAGREGKE